MAGGSFITRHLLANGPGWKHRLVTSSSSFTAPRPRVYLSTRHFLLFLVHLLCVCLPFCFLRTRGYGPSLSFFYDDDFFHLFNSSSSSSSSSSSVFIITRSVDREKSPGEIKTQQGVSSVLLLCSAAISGQPASQPPFYNTKHLHTHTHTHTPQHTHTRGYI
jgi:hypothetical protein